jgi:hypothetical protein
MAMHHLDLNKPIAECIFWYWDDKEIEILQVGVKYIEIFSIHISLYRKVFTHLGET